MFGPRLHKIIICTMQKQPPEVFCKKKVFLKILQESQENTCVGVSGEPSRLQLYAKETPPQIF